MVCTLFRSYSEDRVINFLIVFIMIMLGGLCFTNVNEFIVTISKLNKGVLSPFIDRHLKYKEIKVKSFH